MLGNLQCTVHDMKAESELFDTTMLIVLIMDTVYTLHAMQNKLKDPIQTQLAKLQCCVDL